MIFFFKKIKIQIQTCRRQHATGRNSASLFVPCLFCLRISIYVFFYAFSVFHTWYGVRDLKLESKETLPEETHNSCFGHHDTKQDKDVHQYEKKKLSCVFFFWAQKEIEYLFLERKEDIPKWKEIATEQIQLETPARVIGRPTAMDRKTGPALASTVVTTKR